MLRIGICDDIREKVEKQVRQITYQMGIRADIRKCYSGMDLLMEIELSGQFDIILLDIELGGMNGIETARQIRENDVNCNIIFITSFEQYSKEAISVHPFAFVDKPITYAQMEKFISDVYEKLQIDDKFAFKSNKTYYNTVQNHIGRPYQDSKLLINEIIESKPPVPDPRGTNALSWTVTGTFNGSKGYYELIIDPASNTVWHFVFKSQ